MKSWLYDLTEWLIDWFGALLVPSLCILIPLIVVGIGYAIYASSNSETFTLKKSEWQCIATEPRTVTTYIQSGKILVPITTTYDECTQYKRNF